MSRRQHIYAQRLFSQRAYQRANRTVPASTPGKLRLNNPATAKSKDLMPWLTRELRVLLSVEDVDTIAWFTVGLCERNGIPAPSQASADEAVASCREGRNSEYQVDPCEAELRQFLGDRTRHFLHELHAFAISPVPLEIYDRMNCYTKHSSSGSSASAVAGIVMATGQAQPRDDSRRSRSRLCIGPQAHDPRKLRKNLKFKNTHVKQQRTDGRSR